MSEKAVTVVIEEANFEPLLRGVPAAETKLTPNDDGTYTLGGLVSFRTQDEEKLVNRSRKRTAALQARIAELEAASRDTVSAYMADEDLGPCINRLEDLTGGQQGGS